MDKRELRSDEAKAKRAELIADDQSKVEAARKAVQEIEEQYKSEQEIEEQHKAALL